MRARSKEAQQILPNLLAMRLLGAFPSEYATPERIRIYNSCKSLLSTLPITKASFTFLRQDPAFFFCVDLKGGMILKITRYENQDGVQAYVNVFYKGDILIQDCMSLDNIVAAVKEFYQDFPNGE